jgi:hypothetical protein
MAVVVLILVGIAFTAFAALVFSLLTIALDKMNFESFSISGPEGWSFKDFYVRYLIIAAVYTFVALPLGTPFLGIPALAVAYKFVFDAGWLQAAVIGFVGGTIALILFILLWVILIAPFVPQG